MVEAEEEATGKDRWQTEDREEHESLRALLLLTLMTRNRSYARFYARAHARCAHSLTPTFLSRSHAHDLPYCLSLVRTRSTPSFSEALSVFWPDCVPDCIIRFFACMCLFT